MYEELIGCRPEGRQHAGTQIKLKKQSLRGGEDGKKYDVMEFDITALPLEVWEALKAEWEGAARHPVTRLRSGRSFPSPRRSNRALRG